MPLIDARALFRGLGAVDDDPMFQRATALFGAAPAPPPPPTYTAAPTAPTTLPGPLMPAGAPADGAVIAVPAMSSFGKAWWAAMRGQTTLPIVQALRILIEGAPVPAGGPASKDPRLASVGRETPDASEAYQQLAWLYEWPDDLLIEVIPGATAARIRTARALLDPGLSREERRLVKLAWARTRLIGVKTKRQELESMLAELMRERAWVETVIKQFQEYTIWFQHHQKKKDVRAANVSTVLQTVSAVVQWIPVVGTALAIAITAVDVNLQYRRLREAIHDFGRAGGQIETGLAAVAALEAIEVGAVEILQAQQTLAVEQENLETQIAALDPQAPAPTPVGALPTLPAARRGGWMAVIGIAAVAALLALARAR